jgi:hypothetical protein
MRAVPVTASSHDLQRLGPGHDPAHGAVLVQAVTHGRATRAISASEARVNASRCRKCLAMTSPSGDPDSPFWNAIDRDSYVVAGITSPAGMALATGQASVAPGLIGTRWTPRHRVPPVSAGCDRVTTHSCCHYCY